jgi:exopolyphosphatase/guanosine-5'-triphosphate,3'-diphosphate pyrophosphatase
MNEHATLAAVDLGSNSFHLQVARVQGDQFYPLDSLREPVRLGAGVTADKKLDDASQERALECLMRFGERLRDFPRRAVRAVGTNSLRVAKNAPQFLKRAQAALGFPIEVIAGREEARLIYLGVAHSLPPSRDRRLVVDIGGGSTEFIIGVGVKPIRLESKYMGCVSYSLKFFPEGRISKSNMKQAELAARNELQSIARSYSSKHWQQAIGSSGTARALGEIIQLNGLGEGDITPKGLDGLRSRLLKSGDFSKIDLVGLRADRIPVLPGGLAIMSAVVAELGIDSMQLATGALRQGILYDMLGRFHHHDMRDLTASQFMQRYHVDIAQAKRVNAVAAVLLQQLAGAAELDLESAAQLLDWAAKLHEIGITVAHSGYHKHSAYIIRNADMPGYSRMEQERLSTLVLAHRGSLKKMNGLIVDNADWAMVMVLRLAVLLQRSRSDGEPPPIELNGEGTTYRLDADRDWLVRNPLTAMALREEVKEWKSIGFELDIGALRELEVGADLATMD